MKKPNKRRPDRTRYEWTYLYYPGDGFQRYLLGITVRGKRRRWLR